MNAIRLFPRSSAGLSQRSVLVSMAALIVQPLAGCGENSNDPEPLTAEEQQQLDRAAEMLETRPADAPPPGKAGSLPAEMPGPFETE